MNQLPYIRGISHQQVNQQIRPPMTPLYVCTDATELQSVNEIQNVTHNNSGANNTPAIQNNDAHGNMIGTPFTSTDVLNQVIEGQMRVNIVVVALKHYWILRKAYLRKSKYFNNIFNNSQNEPVQNSVFIEISDDRINVQALNAVFAAMYSNEISIEPQMVISVLVTAKFFDLNFIIEECAKTMIESITSHNIINYYEVACEFGCLDVKAAVFEWLELFIVHNIAHLDYLSRMNAELMTGIIRSPKLFVANEFAVYKMLRIWVYLHLPQSNNPEMRQLLLQAETLENNQLENYDKIAEAAQHYFTTRVDRRPFVNTPAGKDYLMPFRVLRAQYFEIEEVNTVIAENIFPRGWMTKHHPQRLQNYIDGAEFLRCSMRCSCFLSEWNLHEWKLPISFFGVNLMVKTNANRVSVQRCDNQETLNASNVLRDVHFMIRIHVQSFIPAKKRYLTQKTAISYHILKQDEQVLLMFIDIKLLYPLAIKLNIFV